MRRKLDPMSSDQPMVSVIVSCYNHERFIRACLDGILMQETDFPVEIVIHDDASTDGSAAIIREYIVRNPGVYNAVLSEENQYSKGISTWGKILFPRVRGKYVAMCEGDDYWTDPHKLQRQVDFLESHPDFTLSFHNAIIHYEDGGKPDHLNGKLETREYTEKEVIWNHYLIATASMLYPAWILKSEIYKEVQRSDKFMYGDEPLKKACIHYGRAYAFADAMSVYRKHSAGATSTIFGIDNLESQLIHAIESKRIFGGESAKKDNNSIALLSSYWILLAAKGKFKKARHAFKTGMRECPILSIRRYLTFPFKAIAGHFKHR